MCGRFILSASATALVQQFNLTGLAAWRPRYNIAPTQEVLTALQPPETAERQARLLRWGLIPPWAEGPAVGKRMIDDQRPRRDGGDQARQSPCEQPSIRFSECTHSLAY